MIGSMKDEDGQVIHGIDGAKFQNELLFLDTLGKKRIKVFINSPGGIFYDGLAIFNAILKSKTKVDTYNVGMAASMAGIILQAGRTRYVADYSLTMIHSPYFVEGEAEGENDPEKAMLKAFQKSTVTILASRNRKGVTADKFNEYLKAETWFNADEAIEAGVADEIENSGEINIPRLKSSDGIMANWKKLNLVVNTAIQKPNIPQMKKVANILNLNEAASEDAIASAVQTIVNDGTAKAAEIVTLKAAQVADKAKYDALVVERDGLKTAKEAADLAKTTAEKAQLVVDAKALVAENVKTGKIKNDAEVIKQWNDKLVADFAGTKTLIEGLPLNREAKKIVNKVGTEGFDKDAIPYSAGVMMAEIAAKTTVK